MGQRERAPCFPKVKQNSPDFLWPSSHVSRVPPDAVGTVPPIFCEGALRRTPTTLFVRSGSNFRRFWCRADKQCPPPKAQVAGPLCVPMNMQQPVGVPQAQLPSSSLGLRPVDMASPASGHGETCGTSEDFRRFSYVGKGFPCGGTLSKGIRVW